MTDATQTRSESSVSRNHRKWDGASRGGVVGNWLFYAGLRCFGLRATYILLFPVVLYFMFFAPTARRASREYLTRLGYTGRLNLWIKSCQHFLTFGKVLLDKLAMVLYDNDRFSIEFDGEEHMRSALHAGKGLIILSGHCGNWAAAGQLLRRLKHKVNIVAYQGERERMRKLLSRVFLDQPFDVITAGGGGDSSLAIISALNRGEVVAIHADRCFNEPGIEVNFLGGMARFPQGPFVLAALSSSPMVRTFAMRQGLYHYHFYASPSETLRFTDRVTRRQQIERCIGEYAAGYETMLLKYPFQWFNFYDFWNGNPEQS